RKKAEKFPTASLDAHAEGEDDDCGAALWADAEEALAAKAPTTIASDMLAASEMIEGLRVLATGDLEVLGAARCDVRGRGRSRRPHAREGDVSATVRGRPPSSRYAVAGAAHEHSAAR